MISIRVYGIVLAAVILIGVISYLWIAGRRKTPEQREKERRMGLNTYGRITDGTVIDTQEIDHGSTSSQLVVYRYEISGVSYEASQDVTSLRHFVDLHTCRIGLPASVKYDPQNPGNSIVIAEGWSGLRKR